MNITDLIVEMLREGKRVELPGIGTFDSEVQAPRHDPQTHIYYPATRNIVFGKDFSGDNAIVKEIAERDCVSNEVAEQMWHNYVDALTDKIGRTGNHRFGELGALSKEGSGYRFEMSEGVVIEAGSAGETPLEEVKTYAHDAADDPFAQFEAVPVTEVSPVAQKSEPVVKPEPEPEPVVEPEPEPVVESESEAELSPSIKEEWQDTLRKLDELPKSKAMLKAEAKAEKERLKAEAKAEKERKRQEKRAKKEAAEEEKMMAERRKAEEKKNAEARKMEEEALRRAEKSAEEARLKAEKRERATLERAEEKVEGSRSSKEEKRAAILAAVAASKKASGEEVANKSVSGTGTDVLKVQQESAAEHERQLAKEREAQAAAEKEAARRQKEEEARQRAAEKEEEANRKAAEKEAARREKEEEASRKAAEKEAARREKEEEASRKAAEKAAAKEEERRRKEERRLEKEAAKAAELNQTENKEEKEEEKKSRKWLWWLLLLLLLLLLGGGGWWLMSHRSAQQGGAAASGKHLDVGVSNDLTYNYDLLTYNGQEINNNAELLRTEMKSYVDNFLAQRNYKGAQASMWNHVMQYVNQRMNELMGDRFAAQRVIPYDDYMYELQEPWMRYHYAYVVRQTVEAELMENGFLDGILDRLVDELRLNEGDRQHTAAEVKQVKEQERTEMAKAQAEAKAKANKKKDEGKVPSFVYVSKESKNGFDIVAGFYLNKSTAGEMAARLHAEGCDAYIIEKNDGYYVSMGSTSTRTAAEAMFNHIKSWYDGDIAIKQW